MRKGVLIIVTIGCTLLCILGLDFFKKCNIEKTVYKAKYYNNIYTRNQSDFVMDRVIAKNDIVVLGSSELSASDNLAYPPVIFNRGYSDFNMVLMGAGHLQSFAQTINVGALQNNIKNGKVVLIVSPQWFTEEGTTAEAFSSRFEESNFVEFLKNGSISDEIKKAVAERANVLLEADQAALKRAKKYEDVFLYHTMNPFTVSEMVTYSSFWDAKLRFQCSNEFSDLSDGIDYDNYVRAEQIDFDALLPAAEEIGKKECTNNEYGVYDSYYDTYVKEKYEKSKGSYETSSFTSSPEYDDLRLFFDVCEEAGIEPMVVSVPVNGRWYDYCGFSKGDRNTYYQNIRVKCTPCQGHNIVRFD